MGSDVKNGFLFERLLQWRGNLILGEYRKGIQERRNSLWSAIWTKPQIPRLKTSCGHIRRGQNLEW